MRNIKYLVILLALVISACSSDNIVPFMGQGCIIDLNYADSTEEACESLSTVCDPIDVLGNFLLLDNARLYLPQSCLDVGDKINYENSKGDYTSFEITLKDHALIRSSYTSFPPCATMPHYCFKSERYLLEMKSDKGNYHLEIEISVYVRGSESNWIQRDGMGIRDSNLMGNTSVFYLALYGQVSSANEYYSEYESLGETFLNVYSVNPPSSDSRAIKIFYNSDYGMVSFIDGNNEEWRIVK